MLCGLRGTNDGSAGAASSSRLQFYSNFKPLCCFSVSFAFLTDCTLFAPMGTKPLCLLCLHTPTGQSKTSCKPTRYSIRITLYVCIYMLVCKCVGLYRPTKCTFYVLYVLYSTPLNCGLLSNKFIHSFINSNYVLGICICIFPAR